MRIFGSGTVSTRNVAFSAPAKRAHDSHLLIACSNRRTWKLFLLFTEIVTSGGRQANRSKAGKRQCVVVRLRCDWHALLKYRAGRRGGRPTRPEAPHMFKR